MSSSAQRDPSRHETQIMEAEDLVTAAGSGRQLEGAEEELPTDDPSIDVEEGEGLAADPANFGSPCQPHAATALSDLEPEEHAAKNVKRKRKADKHASRSSNDNAHERLADDEGENDANQDWGFAFAQVYI